MTVIDNTVVTVALTLDGMPTSDTFTLANDECPGRCSLLSGGSAYGWDERAGYGLTGATLVPKGDPLNTYAFKVDLWEAGQWDDFQAFAAKYLSQAVKYLPGTTTPRALGIYHPVLSAPPLNVTEVVVDHVTALVQDDDGMWSCEVHFRQYRKPVLALGKQEAVIAANQNPTPTAEDNAAAEFSAKGSQFGALAGQL